MSVSLANKKTFSIQKTKNAYNLIVIDRNLLQVRKDE